MNRGLESSLIDGVYGLKTDEKEVEKEKTGLSKGQNLHL